MVSYTQFLGKPTEAIYQYLHVVLIILRVTDHLLFLNRRKREKNLHERMSRARKTVCIRNGHAIDRATAPGCDCSFLALIMIMGPNSKTFLIELASKPIIISDCFRIFLLTSKEQTIEQNTNCTMAYVNGIRFSVYVHHTTQRNLQ